MQGQRVGPAAAVQAHLRAQRRGGDIEHVVPGAAVHRQDVRGQQVEGAGRVQLHRQRVVLRVQVDRAAGGDLQGVGAGAVLDPHAGRLRRRHTHVQAAARVDDELRRRAHRHRVGAGTGEDRQVGLGVGGEIVARRGQHHAGDAGLAGAHRFGAAALDQQRHRPAVAGNGGAHRGGGQVNDGLAPGAAVHRLIGTGVVNVILAIPQVDDVGIVSAADDGAIRVRVGRVDRGVGQHIDRQVQPGAEIDHRFGRGDRAAALGRIGGLALGQVDLLDVRQHRRHFQMERSAALQVQGVEAAAALQGGVGIQHV